MFGSTQFILAIGIGEALYTGYSTANNLISELGIGNTVLIFNSSIVLLGVCLLLGGIFLFRASRKVAVALLIGLGGVGAIIVGFAPMNTFGLLHAIGSQFAYACSGIAALLAARLEKPPLATLSIALGIIALAALAILFASLPLGLSSTGSIERMIAYPVLLWYIAFGGFLTAQ